METIHEWVHVEAIQALVHHVTGVAAAVLLFALTARLIAYLLPDGYAKRLVIIIDDFVLLAVFALGGYRLLSYLLVNPHLAVSGQETPVLSSNHPPPNASEPLTTLALCRTRATTAPALHQCIIAELHFSERMLNLATSELNTTMQARQASTGTPFGAQTQFDTAEQKFLEFSQADCTWRGAIAGPQSAEDAYLACRADLTRQRADEIERALSNRAGAIHGAN